MTYKESNLVEKAKQTYHEWNASIPLTFQEEMIRDRGYLGYFKYEVQNKVGLSFRNLFSGCVRFYKNIIKRDSKL